MPHKLEFEIVAEDEACVLGCVEEAGEAGAAVGLVDVCDVEAVLRLPRQLHPVQDPLVLPASTRALAT